MFVEKTGDGETEWEGYPNAQDTDAARKTERIAQRQTDDEVGNEGIGHHWFHAGNTSQRIGKSILQTVAKLVEHHHDDEQGHVLLHLHIIIEPAAYLMSEQQHRNAHAEREQQVESPTIVGVSPDGSKVVLSHEMAHSDGQRCSHTREYEVEQLGDSYHHLMGS